MSSVATMLDRQQRMPPTSVLIDLDGTLLDTLPDLAAAANAMRLELGLTPLPADRIGTFVGKGAESLIHRTLTDSLDGKADPAWFEQGRDSFLRHYEAGNGVFAQLYPGVLQGLQALQAMGLKLACVTNKPLRFSTPLLAAKGLLDFFPVVIGGDCLPTRKPDPAQLVEACRRLETDIAQAVVLGDSLNDFEAARRAGCRVLMLPYGYNEGHDVGALAADGIVPTIADAAVHIAAWVDEAR